MSKKQPADNGVNGLRKVEPTGIEPATSWMQTSESPAASEGSKALTPTPSAACTAACTSEPENANASAPEATSPDTPPQAADTLITDQGSQAAVVSHRGQGEGTSQGDLLTKLAAALLTLSPADRAELSKLLTEHQSKQGTN